MTRATSRLTSCIALVLAARSAQATPPCRTDSARPTEEIVLPEPGRPPAVWIKPGETLCLSAEMDPGGEVHSLRLSDHAPSVQLRLEAQEANSRLTLTNLTANGVSLLLSRPRGAANLVLSTQRQYIPPLETRTISFRGRAPGVALMGFTSYQSSVEERASAPASTPPRDMAGRGLAVSFNLLGGMGQMPLQEVNRSLESYGYSPVEAMAPMIGFGLEVDLARFRLGLTFFGRTQKSTSAAGDVIEVTRSDGGFFLGYDMLRWRGFSALVATGLSYGGVGLDASHPGYPVFSRRLGGAPDSKASTLATGLTGELGLEQIIPFWRGEGGFGLALGVRGGYAWLSGSEPWTDDESGRPAGQGPAVALSGFRARVSIGAILFD